VEDIAPALPSALVTPRQLERRGTRIGLAGRFPWRSGPLRGQLISTVRLQTGRVHRRKVHLGHAPSPRGHELYVELHYRARRLQGEVRNDFRAIDAPICKLRDACGTHGSQVFSIESPNERVDVTGVARVRSRHKPSLRRALRTILRHGNFSSFTSLERDGGLTTHVLVRPGTATCNDRFRPRTGPLIVMFGHRRKLTLDMFSAESDVLRGRCPGPTEEQGGGGILARARVPSKALLRRTIGLQLKARRAFAGGAYRGKRSARVNLVLHRTGARVSIDPTFDREYYLFAFSSGTTSARSAPWRARATPAGRFAPGARDRP
jgi:hypothetical protein